MNNINDNFDAFPPRLTLDDFYVIFCDIRIPLFRNNKIAMTPHCVKRSTLLFFKLQVKYH